MTALTAIFRMSHDPEFQLRNLVTWDSDEYTLLLGQKHLWLDALQDGDFQKHVAAYHRDIKADQHLIRNNLYKYDFVKVENYNSDTFIAFRRDNFWRNMTKDQVAKIRRYHMSKVEREVMSWITMPPAAPGTAA